MSPLVKPIFNLSRYMYMPIMKCDCRSILHFSSEDQRWKKKHTIKTVSGKVAHALWLAYEMLFITGKKKKIAQRAVYLCLKQL